MNKADRSTARPDLVDSDILDLFCALGATDEQMEYPLIYASAKQGWASSTPPAVPTAEQEAENVPPADDMIALFDMILSEVPSPARLDRAKPFSMLTTQIDSDTYVGTLYLGRVESGTLTIGKKLIALDPEGKKVGEGKVTKLFGRVGLEKVSIDKAGAGEIVSIAGIAGGGVNVTIIEEHEGMEPLPVSFQDYFSFGGSSIVADGRCLCLVLSRLPSTRRPSPCSSPRTTLRSPVRTETSSPPV